MVSTKAAERNTFFHCGEEIKAGYKSTSVSFKRFEDNICEYGYYHLRVTQGNGYNDAFSVDQLQTSWRNLRNIMDFCNKNKIYFNIKKYDLETYEAVPKVKFLDVDIHFFMDKFAWLKMENKKPGKYYKSWFDKDEVIRECREEAYEELHKAIEEFLNLEF